MNSNIRYNIVLIVLDTVRYDQFSKSFLRARLKINNLAYFHNVFSTATWTPPAHASIFTGLLPHQHGILANGDRLPPLKAPGLAGRLRRLGYKTLAFSANPVAVPFIGRGFDRIIEVNVGRRRTLHNTLPGILSVLRSDRDKLYNSTFTRSMRKIARNSWYFLSDLEDSGRKYLGAFRLNEELTHLMLEGAIKEPFFIFMNYMDAHDYLISAFILKRWIIKTLRCRRLSEDLYRSAIRRLNLGLRELFQALQKLGLLDHTYIIITSDHGEMLGEYGLLGHDIAYPYNELIHVPLAIYDPRGSCSQHVYKVMSIKHIYDMILGIAKGEPICNLLESFPPIAIVEDRTFGVCPKHYRAVICPPYKLVYDVQSNRITLKKIRLEGYSIRDSKDVLELCMGHLQRVNIEAKLYHKLRKIKQKLSFRSRT